MLNFTSATDGNLHPLTLRPIAGYPSHGISNPQPQPDTARDSGYPVTYCPCRTVLGTRQRYIPARRIIAASILHTSNG